MIKWKVSGSTGPERSWKFMSASFTSFYISETFPAFAALIKSVPFRSCWRFAFRGEKNPILFPWRGSANKIRKKLSLRKTESGYLSSQHPFRHILLHSIQEKGNAVIKMKNCLQYYLHLFRETLVQLAVRMRAIQTGPRQSRTPSEVRFAPFKLLCKKIIESRQTGVQLFLQSRARLLAGAQEVNQDYQCPRGNANCRDLVLEKDRLTEWPCSIHFLVNQSYDHVLLLLPHVWCPHISAISCPCPFRNASNIEFVCLLRFVSSSFARLLHDVRMTSPHNSCGALPPTLGTKKFLHQTVAKQDLRCVGFNNLRAI